MRSTDLLAKYCREHGCHVEHLFFGPRGKSEFVKITAPNNQSVMLDASHLIYPFSTSTAKRLSGDKALMHDYITHLNDIRQPPYIVCNNRNVDENSLAEFIARNHSVVIKPRRSFGSRGLTINVRSTNEAIAAIGLASKFSRGVIVQQQVTGEEYRFMTIDSKVCSVLIRKRASVTGDGVRTVAALIALENTARSKITNTMVPYPPLSEKLIPGHFLTDKTVLKKDEILELSASTLIRGGASVYDVFESIHPSYIDVAEKIAKPLGSGLLCVDIMIEKATIDAAEKRYNFIETNLIPSLPMCYSCRDGKQFTIVESYIGPMILRSLGMNQ